MQQSRSLGPACAGGSIPPAAASPNWLQSVGTGERALHVTEELALEQRLGEGRTVDGNGPPNQDTAAPQAPAAFRFRLGLARHRSVDSALR